MRRPRRRVSRGARPPRRPRAGRPGRRRPRRAASRCGWRRRRQRSGASAVSRRQRSGWATRWSPSAVEPPSRANSRPRSTTSRRSAASQSFHSASVGAREPVHCAQREVRVRAAGQRPHDVLRAGGGLVAGPPAQRGEDLLGARARSARAGRGHRGAVPSPAARGAGPGARFPTRRCAPPTPHGDPAKPAASTAMPRHPAAPGGDTDGANRQAPRRAGSKRSSRTS